MRNIRLDICYDGTRYRGWQRLPGKDDTIQGKLETALSRILEEPIEISGSWRNPLRFPVPAVPTRAFTPGDRLRISIPRVP